MRNNKRIILDAVLVSVIKDSAFRARLANGHCFVAYAGKSDAAKAAGLRPGDTVKVSFSSYDMSSGQMEVEDLENESTQFSEKNV